VEFFVLEVQVGSSHETRFDKMEPVHRGETADCQTCPVCGEDVGMLPWLPPYRAELKAYGKALGDVAFGPSMELLVSDRFRQAWEARSLRGVEFAPLERLRIRPARLGKKGANYFEMTPRHFGTRVDLKRSLIEFDKPFACNKCMNAGVDTVRGFAIDEKSWTGEDIFYTWGLPGSIVVTDRVRQLRDEHSLTNINLTPVEQYFWDPLSKWTPVDYSPPDWYKPDEDSDDEPTPNA
jgi:hypothetical protein